MLMFITFMLTFYIKYQIYKNGLLSMEVKMLMLDAASLTHCKHRQ